MSKETNTYTPPKGCPPLGECIEWKKYINKKGYAQISRNEVKKVFSRIASRVLWIEKFGNIPDGLHVLHKCDNRKCVNMDHLFLGTNADNVKDKMSKGRQARGTMVKQSFLDETDIKLIRFLHNQGNSTRTLEQWFPIKKSSIHKIVAKKSWTHV